MKRIPISEEELNQFNFLIDLIYPDLPMEMRNSKKLAFPTSGQPFIYHDGEGLCARNVIYDTKDKQGFEDALLFGYFEAWDSRCIPYVIEHLSEEALARGKKRIIGPINEHTSQGYRFSLMGPVPLFPGEPFHPTYYERMFKEAGFECLHSYSSSVDETLSVNLEELRADRKEYEKLGYTFSGLDPEHIEQDLADVIACSRRAFQKNFMYSEASNDSMYYLYKRMLNKLDTSFIQLVRNSKGLVAFMFAYPNPYDTSRESIVIKTVARDPKNSTKGIGQYLVGKTTLDAREKGFRRVIHALMPDDSHSHVISKDFSGTLSRHYELLEMKV